MKLTRRDFLKASGCSAIAITAGIKSHNPVIAGPVFKAADIKKQSKIFFYNTPAGKNNVLELFFNEAKVIPNKEDLPYIGNEEAKWFIPVGETWRAASQQDLDFKIDAARFKS